MVRIHQGYVTESKDKSILVTEIDFGNNDKREVLISVDSKYGKFLSPERADYILIGLFVRAMKRNEREIICEAPVTEELFYNINEILIPTLLRSDSRYHPIKIHADIAPPLDKLPFAKKNRVGGGVGTGLSCGVDSLHAVLKHLDSPYPHQNLTHLVVMDIGNFQNGVYEKGGLAVKEKTIERAEKVVAELNLPLIKIESNFQKVIPLGNLYFHTYRSVMAVYAMQKLWRIYYYGSGYSFKDFTLKNSFSEDPAYYDLLLFDCLSTAGLRLISEGGEGDRNDKINFIADNPIAQKYLHACIRTDHNCGICEKCLRTLLAIDATGKLDNFRESFDIDAYLKIRKQAYIYCHDKAAIPHSAPFYAKTYKILYARHKEFFDSITPETKRIFKTG